MESKESGKTEKRLYLGIEIGGTKQQIALGDGDGNIYFRKVGKSLAESGTRGILGWMMQNVPGIIAKESELGGRVLAIGVGFGGIVESATGKVELSVQVDGWENFSLREWFEKSFRIQTIVINDTVTGGFGEYFCGTGKNSRHFFYTNIGSGIGGVFITGGRIYDGNGYGAAYFGHTYVPDCFSGEPFAYRKVEDLCSGWAIEKRLRVPGYVPPNSIITQFCEGRTEKISCKMLEDAAKSEDDFALLEVEKIATELGIGLANVITLFSPDCIAVGGGVGKMGDCLLDPVRRCVEKLVFASVKGRYQIRQCLLGDEAVLVGALLAASRAFDPAFNNNLYWE